MRLDGTLKSWNDDRGFGFIEPVQGGQDIFVHIKAFPGGSGRPNVGQALTFAVEVGPDGKKRALAVQYPVRSSARKSAPQARQAERSARWTWPRLLVLPLFAAVWLYVARKGPVVPIAWMVYAAMGVVTFLAYALDKSAAVHGRRRTRESSLHMLGLACGWPGALLAQQLLRHKSSKREFIGVFWLTVGANIAGFVAWHRGLGGLTS